MRRQSTIYLTMRIITVGFCYVNSYSQNTWKKQASTEQKNHGNLENSVTRERFQFLHVIRKLYGRNRDELTWLRNENPSCASCLGELSYSAGRLPKVGRRHARRHRVSQKNKPDRLNASSWGVAKRASCDRADKDHCAQDGTSSSSEAQSRIDSNKSLIQTPPVEESNG